MAHKVPLISIEKNSDECLVCKTVLNAKENFCPNCGAMAVRELDKQNDELDMGRAIRGIAAYLLVPLAILLLVNVGILIWSAGIVLPETADLIHGSNLYFVVPAPNPVVNVWELRGATFAGYHLFLIAAILLAFALVVYRSMPLIRDEIGMKRGPLEHSPLYTIGTLFFAILSFQTLFSLALSFLGVTPNTPDFEAKELWQLLNGLASASVWEEMIIRVLMIGVPLLALGFFTGRPLKLRRYVLGGGFSLGRAEIFLIIASSAVFGLAHIVSWDIFKVAPAMVAGFAFGYLFLTLGIYASIVLHFSIDYLYMPYEVTSNAYISMVLVLLIIAWELIGVAYLWKYSHRGFNALKRVMVIR